MPHLSDELPNKGSQNLTDHASEWDTPFLSYTQPEDIADSELPWPNTTNYSDFKTAANISFEAWFGDIEREKW